MNRVQVTMPLSASIVLNDVIQVLLYSKKTTSDGREYIVDRSLPFNLRYRLNKNRLLFQKDAEYFNNQRLFALAKYGTPSEDGKNVILATEDAKEKFKEELGRILEGEVTHDIIKLSPEDINLVKDTDINISPDAMGLFIGYLTDDDDLQKDLNTPVVLKFKETTPVVEAPVTEEKPKKTTTKKSTTTKTQKKLQNIAEKKPVLDGVEEVKTEEAPKGTPKKTTTKKSTTSKKTTTKKAETTETSEEAPKKTTTRKPRTKKVTEETVNG